jgi:S-formylglutathione hydrolase FrmB
VGDNNTEGECSGAGAVFVDNGSTDPYRRVVSGRLDAAGDVPSPTRGTHFNVLLPRSYDSSARRYPVLYLFAGLAGNQNSWLAQTDLVHFTDSFVGDQAVIVVNIADSDFGTDADWRNGRWLWESLIVERLIPYIDSHFRTLADRSHRAIAGDSGGGWTTMHIAARHPDLFAAAGSFSGFLDLALTAPSPVGESAILPVFELTDGCGGGNPPFDAGVFGDPLTSDVWWHDASPIDLAGNLHGLSLYVASGNGVPCTAGDVASQLGPPPVEPLIDRMSQEFSAALTNAGVKHTTDFYGCGLHTWPYFERDLKKFWPIMLAAFGGGPPASFDYRTADSAQHSVGLRANSVYGWTFTPDPARAAEFLDAHNVSSHGLVLTGSGRTSVRTAALFTPGDHLLIRGAGGPPMVVIANGAGQITFIVDLGAPHTLQQYTAAERVAEASPSYFHTQTITFTRAAP